MYSDKPLKRGYAPTRKAKQALLPRLQTRLGLTVLTAVLDHAGIIVCALLGYLVMRTLPAAAALPIQLPLLLISARCQRGLECLVHEASHLNWTRLVWLNDLLGNVLAAWSVFSTVAGFRRGHMPHHAKFGTAEDTDRHRYAALDLNGLCRDGLAVYARGLMGRMGEYVIGWWKAIGFDLSKLLAGLTWHVLLILGASAIVGLRTALWMWGAYWLLPMFVVLPVLRFIAEAAKHKYEGHDTVFDATVSNVGFWHRLLLHPHNDGYHLMHHLFPAIPHHELASAAHDLKVMDPDFARRQKTRDGVLQEPH